LWPPRFCFRAGNK